jgi:Uma2 family endonuclease
MVIDRVFSKRYPNSVVWKDVSWNFYRAMLREYDERPSRINYSRGTLEVMTLSIEHERYKAVLGLMVGLIALTFRLRVAHGGSSTLKRMAKKKGLEADQCYWVANEATMRTKKRINLKTDPPPDLVVEIDVMHSVVNREKIYAALGVPEMWVLSRDARLAAHALDGGAWKPVEHSLSFPFLRVADLNPFVARIGVDDDTSVLSDFTEWVRGLRPSPAPATPR